MRPKCTILSCNGLQILTLYHSIRLPSCKSTSISRFRRAFQSRTQPTKTRYDSSLFSYTSGRFLFNEQARLKERHVKFNVAELKGAAQVSFKGEHGKVDKIGKLAEGGFNRIFLLQMEDGFELIAKIPYRIAEPEFFTTASEVATLTFLRSKGIPVPEVYAYCAKSANPVCSEYILMEKAPGISISGKWNNLETLEIRRLAHSFVEIEKTLFKIPFGAIGSLYFKDDIQLHLQAPLYSDNHRDDESDRFCIGPIADYMFWYGTRAGLSIDRGPWRLPVDYLRSIACKEIAMTQQFGQPMEPKFPHNALGLGVQRPEDYLKVLNDYVSLTPHLTPKDLQHSYNQPTLRHPDLTPSNIFFDPKTSRISCLIDWQHAVIQPQLLAAGYPSTFANPDSDFGPELIEPTLPTDMDKLPAAEQEAAHELYRRRMLFYCYRVFNGAFNDLHIAALRDPLLRVRHLLVDYAGRPWIGNIMTLKGSVIRTSQFWDHLPDVGGIPCPVHLEQEELDKFAEQEEDWINSSILLENYRTRICNMNEDGWVRNEDFEQAKVKLRKLEEETWLQCKGDEEDEHAFRTGWPFRDHDESSTV